MTSDLPVFPPDAQRELYRLHEAARSEHPPAPEVMLGQFIIKTVTDCNMRCAGKGYECYEYVDDTWRDLPPKMSDETMHQLGTKMGTYAQANGLEVIAGVFHGGEPLYTPGEPPEKYYARTIPILKSAVAAAAPKTKLRLSMHTNGTRLRERILDVLSDHDVGVGVSLDGYAEAHNRNRVVQHNGQRIGMFLQTERGLNVLRHNYRHLFRGIIAVIDVRNDPYKVLETIAGFEPPRIDFHLPYAGWDAPPPGLDIPIRELDVIKALRVYDQSRGDLLVNSRKRRAAAEKYAFTHPSMVSALQLADYANMPGTDEYAYAVPYADWLLKVFEANQKREEPLNIRLFDSIKSLAMGGPSASEAIGPMAGREIIVRTDGSIELPDSLKVMYPNAANLNLNVATDGIDRAAAIMRAGGHLGRKSVADACRPCDLLAICGGGHIATRYSKKDGFNTPSVYCLDLEKLSRHIRSAVVTQKQVGVGKLLAKRPQTGRLPRLSDTSDVNELTPPKVPAKFAAYVGPTDWEEVL